MKRTDKFEREISPLLDEAGVKDKKYFMNKLETLYNFKGEGIYLENFSKDKYLNTIKWRNKSVLEHAIIWWCNTYTKKDRSGKTNKNT